MIMVTPVAEAMKRAIVPRMRKIRRSLDARAKQLLERHSEIHFEDQLLVVFQVNEEREIAETGQLLAKEPDVFARRPGVDDVGRAPIGKNGGPVSVELVEALHGIVLRAQSRTAVFVFGNSHGRRMAKGGELVREVMHVDGAVRAEVVIEDKENVTHARAERRL